MARQVLTMYYDRLDRNLYDDSTLAVVDKSGPQFYKDNYAYTLHAYIYSNSAAFNMGDLDANGWSFAIGNMADPVVSANSASFNIAGDGSNVTSGHITIRVNCASSELTSELGSLVYKNYYASIRANCASDQQTIALFNCVVRNTVIT